MLIYQGIRALLQRDRCLEEQRRLDAELARMLRWAEKRSKAIIQALDECVEKGNGLEALEGRLVENDPWLSVTYHRVRRLCSSWHPFRLYCGRLLSSSNFSRCSTFLAFPRSPPRPFFPLS